MASSQSPADARADAAGPNEALSGGNFEHLSTNDHATPKVTVIHYNHENEGVKHVSDIVHHRPSADESQCGSCHVSSKPRDDWSNGCKIEREACRLEVYILVPGDDTNRSNRRM